jgi:hypothetical protein
MRKQTCEPSRETIHEDQIFGADLIGPFMLTGAVLGAAFYRHRGRPSRSRTRRSIPRSLGPAVFAGGEALTQLWVLFAAPIAGAVIGALIYRWLDEYGLCTAALCTPKDIEFAQKKTAVIYSTAVLILRCDF